MAMTAKTDDQAATPSDTPEKDSPLLDLSDAAVKKFIKTAKARGFVTLDALNAVLPSEEVSPDQIEDTVERARGAEEEQTEASHRGPKDQPRSRGRAMTRLGETNPTAGVAKRWAPNRQAGLA